MQRINKYLIALYLFLCPIELALNIIFGSTTKYVGVLLLLAWGATLIYDEHERQTDITNYVISVFIWLAYCLLSLIWCEISSYTTEYLTTYLQMGLFVFICTYKVWKQNEINIFIDAYCLGSICMALAMLFLGGNEFSGRGTVTILGKFCDSNQVAANIVPGVLVSYFKLFEKRNKTTKQIAYMSGFLLTTYAVLLSSSRGGLVAILVGISVISIIQSRKHSFRFGLFLILVAVASLVVGLLPIAARQRLFNFSSYTDEYAHGGSRLTLWSYLFETFDAQWIIGHGVGSTITFFTAKLGYDCGVHNTFVLVLYEVGIIGFVFFIYPYIGMIIYHFKRKNAVHTVLLICAMISSFFLDALNLRYLWNGLIICIIQFSFDANSGQNNNLKQNRYIKHSFP